MQPITVTVGPLTAASDNGICTAQTLPDAGNLSINGLLASGGVAKLNTPRQIAVTSSGDDTGIKFTIYGTTYGGYSVSQTIDGVDSGSSSTTVDFLTVTRVYSNGATSGNVIVGTNSVAGSRWVRMDSWAFPQTAIQLNATGTVNYTLQVTMDDPNSLTNPVAIQDVTWLNTNDTDAVTATGDVFSNFEWTPTWTRILLNSGSGIVTGTFAQFNAVSK